LYAGVVLLLLPLFSAMNDGEFNHGGGLTMVVVVVVVVAAQRQRQRQRRRWQ
jgi:hypothetical protein